MGRKAIDVTGMRSGRLTVICRDRVPGPSGAAMWICRCDCGNTVSKHGKFIATGHTRSCGCLLADVVKETNKSHGMSKDERFSVWCSMISRCYNRNVAGYPNYGGRGIRVCDRWRNDFAAFASDMGTRPSKQHQIDRVNNDGDYEPSNCKWATRFEQAGNRRSNINVCHDGKTMNVAEWARATGISAKTIRKRIRDYGWSGSRAVSTPPRKVSK